MSEILTISKTESSFPDYLDFSKLREAGLKHIEELGSDLWTDYNLHDPGITILEVLCYALTDLGYRTNFDIKDLLALSKEQKNARSTSVLGLPQDNNFFSAAEILSCNPVTTTDLRKLLIDIPGVKNAWLEPAEQGEIPIFLNGKTRKLQYEETAKAQGNGQVKVKGLYNVCIEPDPIFTTDPCGRSFFSSEDIIAEVYRVLNAHRNLCEDVKDVIVFGEEEIGICADIELAPDADPEDVLLAMYKNIEEFLSPTLRFYTLQEMLDRGRRIEDIFAGRPLRPRSHGFIDPDDLKKLEPRDKLYASDLIEIIMEVPGVLAVHKFVFGNNINGLRQTKGERWCLQLNPKYRPHLERGETTVSSTGSRPVEDKFRTRITFFKGPLSFSADINEVNQRYLEEKIAETKVFQDPYDLDLPVPDGTHHELADFISITNDFPLTYRINEGKVKGASDEEEIYSIPDPLRRAQVRQLKAYLLFYDQILANYLAQLANVRELFAVRPPVAANGHTYLVQLLEGMPGIEDLIENYYACQNNADGPPNLDTYPDYLQHIAESVRVYQDRRNRFLDHLLARFAESMTEYVLLMFKVEGQRHDLAKIIEDKTEFLQSYPKLSHDRGKAYNYRPVPAPPITPEETVWDTEQNISGLERRVSRLLGMDKVGRFSLSQSLVQEVGEGWYFEILDEAGSTWLRGSTVFTDQTEAEAALATFLELASAESRYRRLTFIHDGLQRYGFMVVDPDGHPFAETVPLYQTAAERDIAVQKLIGRLRMPGVNCRVEQEEECFFFYLYPPGGASGGTYLFRSARGYPNYSSAEEALQQFLALAIHFEQYELIPPGAYPSLETGEIPETGETGATDWEMTGETGETGTEPEILYGFLLLDSNGEVLAIHPDYYDSEEERNDRLQAIIYYLDNQSPKYGDYGTMGSYQFEVFDDSNNQLFSGIRYYNTRAEARADFHLLQELARCRDFYQEEELTGEVPFGFVLLDRHEDILAEHPQGYASGLEREWVIRSIIYSASNEALSAYILPVGEQYYYQLRDQEGRVLMQSAITYLSENGARVAWQEFVAYAGAEVSYEPTSTTDGYSFELLNGDGEVIAYHPETYELEAERDAALRAVANFVCHTSFLINIFGDPGAFYFQLLGVGGRELLHSWETYPDRETAWNAFQNFLRYAREYENYYVNTDGFEVRDNFGQVLAVNTDYYPTDGAREATIAMILAYLRDDPVETGVLNEEGAFRIQVFDQDRELVLQGVEVFYAEEEGHLGAGRLLELALDFDNFRKTEAGSGLCPYSFELVDEFGVTVAVHPHTYPEPARRDEVMIEVFAYLTNGEALVDDSIQEVYHYQYELEDAEGNPLLRSLQAFPSRAEADMAFADMLEWAAQRAHYQIEPAEETGTWRVSLSGQPSEVLAVCPGEFVSEEEAEEAIRAIMLRVQTQGLGLRIEGVSADYEYTILGPEEQDFLISLDSFTDEAEAGNAIVNALTYAGSIEQYHLVNNPVTCQFGFELMGESGPHLARYPSFFHSPEERDEALNAFILYLQTLDLSPGYREVVAGYRLVLRDFSDGALASLITTFGSGNNQWDYFLSEEDARAYFLNEFLPHALQESNYENRLEYVPAPDGGFNCVYSIRLRQPGGEALILNEQYSNREERDDAFADILGLLRAYDVLYELEGTHCGYYFYLDAGTGHELRSFRRYPDEVLARRACVAVADYLAETGRCEAWETEAGFYTHLLDEEGDIAMESTVAFPSAAEALDVCHQLAEAVQQPVSMDSELVFKPRGYACRIIDGEEVLLESVGRANFRVHLIWPVIYDEEAEREEAMEMALAFFRQFPTPTEENPDIPTVTEADGNEYFYFELGETGETISLRGRYPLDVMTHSDTKVEVFTRFLQEARRPENYRRRQDENGCCYWFEIISEDERSEAYERACEGCKRLLEEGQEEENYRIMINQDDCRFAFQLLNGAGVLALPPVWSFSVDTGDLCYYDSMETCRSAITAIRELINREGMHLIEHILLRPKNPGELRRYFFELQVGETVYFRSAYSYDSRGAAGDLLKEVFDAFLDYKIEYELLEGDPPGFKIIQLSELTTEEELETGSELIYTYQVVDEEGCVLAETGRCFAGRTEVYDDIWAVRELLLSIPEELPDVETGITGEPLETGEIDTGTAFYEMESVIEGAVKPTVQVEDDLAGDDLLPPVTDCETTEKLCPDVADPYSFRATVVLPYWPARFRQPEFRAFIETTLRKEAPAHVFLRICWVGPCQMREFEQRYRAWLESMALGEESCHHTQALNDLIDILFRLRNVYPASRLVECDQTEGAGSLFILNQTVLGNANSLSDDTTV